MRTIAVILSACAIASSASTEAATLGQDCGVSRGAPTCGSLTGDEAHGDFRGLIMVRDQPDVLDRAADAGTSPGCGDCVWEIILSCPTNLAGSPEDAAACSDAAANPRCRPGQQLYRLYLTTAAVTNSFNGDLCLGDITDVVPVGNIAAADVDRYLRNVAPPDLVLTTSPPSGTLVGLPTYFRVRPPTDLAPAPF